MPKLEAKKTHKPEFPDTQVDEEKDPKEIVRFAIANLTDIQASNGKSIPSFEFHYRPVGAPAEELPTKYKITFGGTINELPREVLNHLRKKCHYPRYEMHQAENGDVYPVQVGVEPRFMITEVGGVG